MFPWVRTAWHGSVSKQCPSPPMLFFFQTRPKITNHKQHRVHSMHKAMQQEMCLGHSPSLIPHSRHRKEGKHREADRRRRELIAKSSLRVISTTKLCKQPQAPFNTTMAYRTFHFLLVGLAVVGSSLDSSSLHLSFRKLSQFQGPTVDGLPLDYCLHYELAHYGPDNSLTAKHGHDCGKPAADEFCIRQGYKEGSEWFSVMYYSRGATYVLGDEAVNPTDTNMGKGEHTYIDRLTCKEKKER